MCPRSSREKGTIGEEVARRYLRDNGFTILDANFHARRGEVDIIARECGEIVFVEVKSAGRTSFGDPLGWIPAWKQNRIILASLAYLCRKGLADAPMRFDVITVDGDGKVTHVRDAFRAAAPFPL